MEESSTNAVVPAMLSRRRLLRASAAGAGVVAGLGIDPLIARPARAQGLVTKTSTPADALAALMAGNQNYVLNKITSCDDLRLRREQTAAQQMPFAAVLSCADSRVPVELIFDQSIGDLFVTRVAGNITTPEIIASLEYSVAVLGTVKLILVLAHTDCGAVRATIKGKQQPGQITALYPHIEPAVPAALRGAQEPTDEEVDAVAHQNARLQAELLSDASPPLKERIEAKPPQLMIASGIYNVLSGVVKFDPS
jgi:carbonic anhydrase